MPEGLAEGIMEINNKPPKKFAISGKTQEIFMLLPMFIGFLLFVIYPIFWVLRWAWFDYGGYDEPIFLGLENFIRAFTRDSKFWLTLINTLYLAAMKILIELPLSLILAFFINGRVKGSTFFRVIYFLPTVFSIAVIGLVFTILFSTYNGIVNAVLVSLKIIKENVNWFSTRWMALNVVLGVSIWSTFGLNMIYFLMGLQNVPKELYECASLDGASGFRQFFHITLPLLAPVIRIIIMLSLLGTMKITDLLLVMTNGQPGGSTEVVMTYIFKFFFGYGSGSSRMSYGYGSALSIVFAAILSILTGVYLRNSKKMNEV
jgi:raffinose/stachyose/melibiose transport system permease protein